MQNITENKPRPSLLRRTARNAARAFTLLEILIVLAIAGMIIGLAVTQLGGAFSGAQKNVAEMFVTSSIKLPLEQYRMHMGNYPTTAEGLQALITAPADKADRWRGPYIEGGRDKLIDPWKEPYQYRFPGIRNPAGYDIWSKGPDMQDGTPDDIGNWPKESNQGGLPGMPGQ